VLVAVFILAGVTVVQDAVRNSRIEVYPQRPAKAMDLRHNDLYYDLVNNPAQADWSMLDEALEWVRCEYDCSDFRLVNLVRILYEFGDSMPAERRKELDEVLLNFRYWWDEPGGNSMCYWSENHQILFASAEYLVGQMYPKAVFPNSGLTGRQHMEKARERALDWLQMRWDYGFIEYYSSVYYKEDIAPLFNLMDFARDEELVQKCRIILDLLFYDMAAQSSGTMFSSVSGRAYKNNRIGREAAQFSGLTNYLWGDGSEIGPHMMYGMMQSNSYELPPVIREIALDTSVVIIRQSNGLDLGELKAEGYYGTDNRSMMMQWGMESFTNPEIIRNTLGHMRNTEMFSNNFIKDFKMLNYRLLQWLYLEPTIARILDPQTNGVSIQKGNTYTYRTPDYALYTVQAHQPGDYADQQHIFGMNIREDFSIFHLHPAREKDVESQSPNYWVGYGHFPHSVQEKNVNLSIYNTPEKKGLMESELLDYTRAYFPSADFDTTIIDGTYAFGKLGDTYCVFIGANPFSWRDESHDDLIQDGKQVFWITEAGSRSKDGSFRDFVDRICNNPVEFDSEALVLNYVSGQITYELEFGGVFKVNGQTIDTNYRRFDSPYVQGDKKDKTFFVTFNNESLFLDFENMIRNY